MLKRDFCRLSLRKTMSVCEDFLPKHFCGRFVPQTFARRIVEPMTDECEVSITEGERIKVSGSQRLVRLLVFSTVPFCRVIADRRTIFATLFHSVDTTTL